MRYCTDSGIRRRSECCYLSSKLAMDAKTWLEDTSVLSVQMLTGVVTLRGVAEVSLGARLELAIEMRNDQADDATSPAQRGVGRNMERR